MQKKFVEYPSLKLKWPEIKDIENIEEAKILFRLANTQFMKSLNYYLLDGYVTEHVQMQMDISKLYQYLASLEEDSSRFVSMHDNRISMLKHLHDELNPKAFEATVVELQVEISQANNTIFDHLYEKIRDSGKRPKWSLLYVMKNFGLQAIEYSGMALTILEAKEDNHEYWQAIFNFRFTRGKVYSKLFDQDPEVQLGYLE